MINDYNNLLVEKIKRNGSFTMNTLHSHPAYELYLLEDIEGEASILIDGKKYHLEKHSFVIIDSLIPHKTDFSKSETHTRFLLEINPAIFDKEIEALSNLSAHEFFRRFTGVHKLEPSTLNRVISILDAINYEYLYKKENSEHIILFNIFNLVLTLQRDFFISISNSKAYLKQNNILEPIIHYINEYFLSDITLDSVANKFFIDKPYLCRLFKSHTGYKVNQYIFSKRVTYAQRSLLVNKNISISDMALHCGFNNVNTFITNFRKFTGLTPLQYRKNFDKN